MCTGASSGWKRRCITDRKMSVQDRLFIALTTLAMLGVAALWVAVVWR